VAGSVADAVEEVQEWAVDHLRQIVGLMDDRLGGPARRRVIVILASVLALAAADQGALSATASDLQAAFHIDHAEFGLLGTVSLLVGAAATLPFGLFVDRRNRTRLLRATVLLWVVATGVATAATDYPFLVAGQVLLGGVVAVAYPAVASLLGDFFTPGERARVYGYVLSGELVGTGLGLALSGGAASAAGSWRAAFAVLVLPAALVWWLLRRLPEPARGGPSRLLPGQDDIVAAADVGSGTRPVADRPQLPDRKADRSRPDLAQEHARRQRVAPRRELVLRDDPARMSLWRAVVYVLRLPTNRLVIMSSALSYFFLSGVRFFGVLYVTRHYGVGRGEAIVLLLVVGIAAVAGVVFGGRLADRWLRRGRLNGRIVVPAVTLPLAAVAFAPAIWTRSVGVALVLFLTGVFLLAAANPPLDASRLDVVPPRLWGRGESVRMMVRSALEAAAPVTFGLVADSLLPGSRGQGLELTFLLMLVPLVASGAVLLMARRSYGRDVATAAASAEACRSRDQPYPADPAVGRHRPVPGYET
jgi:predicted MFS family arabinose efflux permease